MPYIGKSPSAGVRQRYQYTATAGQTTFSGTDLGNLTLTYTDNNFVDVFQNGVLLKGGGTDYTATSGTSVVLATGASVSDVIEIIVYDVFSVGNFFNRTDSDSRFVRHDSATAGTDNFIAGKNAGDAIVSGGNNNTLVGNEAGTSLTTGDNNVAVGFEALATEDADGNNVAVGYQALKTLNAGAEGKNTAVGYKAGTAITTGIQNTLTGHSAGMAITAGDKNTAIGFDALPVNTDSNKNTAVGKGTLTTFNVTDGSDTHNTAVGHDAGNDLTTGTNNTIVGSLAGDALTTGGNNVAIGIEALSGDTTGSNSTAIGRNALFAQNFTGSENSENTAVGSLAGQSVTSGQQNTLMGMGAGGSITTGSANICIGREAAAGSNDISGETPLTTGSGNVIVGKACQAHSASASTVIVMGFECTATGNENFTFGKGSTDSNIAFGGTSISAPSDERYKENIETSTAGLGFINDLRPVTFKWKMEKDVPSDHKAYVKDSTTRVMSAKDEFYHGFIAQEVKAAIDKHSEVKNYDGLWAENIDGRQRVAPAELIPMLTKAVQELSAKNDALEARIKKLEGS